MIHASRHLITSMSAVFVIMLTYHSSIASPQSGAAVYIYKSDSVSAESFKNLLGAAGISTALNDS